jgi:putative glutamine amidotransferase
MPSAPMIGITATTEMQRGACRVRVNAAYSRAVEESGGVPVILPPLQTLAAVGRLLDHVDGLLLTGGEDVGPERFGQARHPALGTVNPVRDATEVELVSIARHRAVPTFAICRGVQLLNVALGGSLVQDIPSERPDALQHDPHTGHDVRSHDVELAPDSRVALALGVTHLRVNSLHHQAVDRVAEGLRLTAWAPDGIVEGVEWAATDWWAVGVQWHPEELIGDGRPWAGRLFGAFVEQARERK